QIASRLPNSHITAVEIVAEATENANALISSLSLDAQVSNINADAVNYVKDMAVKNADAENTTKDMVIKNVDAENIVKDMVIKCRLQKRCHS
ncbi:MAG: hypothetical protein RSC44_05380, partial [Clostridia bacterium]